MKIGLTTEKLLSEFCKVLGEAANWLESKGMKLWSQEELTIEEMRQHLLKEELYHAEMDGQIVGTIIIQKTDNDFWPEAKENEALYFHKLAVARDFSGQGVAKALIHFAEKKALDDSRMFLRADCSAKHPRLRTYYEGYGFTFVDQREVGSYLVDRLQKRLITREEN